MLVRKLVVLPPVVVAEMLSDPALPPGMDTILRSLPELPVTAGYWRRSGELRSQLARRGFKARLADTLIAQSCLDYKSALLTRDKGFQRFASVAGLKLLG
jgi:hypothetical protein